MNSNSISFGAYFVHTDLGKNNERLIWSDYLRESAFACN